MSFDPVSYAMGKAAGGGSPVLTTLSATENKTYTPEAPAVGFSQVEVEVPVGYTGYETITGTLANPWGDKAFADVLADLLAAENQLGAYASFVGDATALGYGTIIGYLLAGTNTIDIIGGSVNASNSNVFQIKYDKSGLAFVYIEQNGTITDMEEYASLVPSTIHYPM